MSSETFMNESNDCLWLADKLNRANTARGVQFQSAVLYGNEDCPIAVDLYATQEPLLSDSFVRVALDAYEA